MARQPVGGLGRLIFPGFTITHIRHTTLGRTPLDEGPARPIATLLLQNEEQVYCANECIFCVLASFESTCLIQQRLLTFLLSAWLIDGMLLGYLTVLFCLHKLCSDEKAERMIISIGWDVS
jgi:hypothetical protein